jgi:anaerobilin synthase
MMLARTDRGPLPFAKWPEETLYAYPVPIASTPDVAQKIASDTTFDRGTGEDTAVYVHVPFCVSLCSFCGFVKQSGFSRDDVEEFVASIEKEIDITSRWLQDTGVRDVRAVFFGGGTASVLATGHVRRLLDCIRSTFGLHRNAELTFEGDCLTLQRPGYLEQIRQLGFQRLSYGVQVMHEGARAVLNLRPTKAALARLCAAARTLFDDVSVDYLYGWPGQTGESLAGDLMAMIEALDPPSIELFKFEHLDAAPALLCGFGSVGLSLPATAQLIELDTVTRDILRRAGYAQANYTKYTRIGTSRFDVYTSAYYGWNNGNVLGFGRGSQSFFRGLMWGQDLVASEHLKRVRSGALAISAAATYGPDERELVTWPRRGWVSRELLVKQLPVENLEDLHRHGYVLTRRDRVELTDLGRVWVPALIEYLMPREQRQAHTAMTRARAALRSPVHLPMVAS